MEWLSRFVGVGLVALLASVTSVESRAQAVPSSGHHTIVSSGDIQWKPLRPGAEIAVISGDPDRAGVPFVMRFRYRGTARIPPHWHPTDEHITVLSGTFLIGMGERADEASTIELAAGAYAMVPAKMPHYAWAKGDTVVQIHGIGPFAINYVNPADDPSKTRKEDAGA
jgi:quercetin dioxygenase-like cupin family protein